MSAHWKKTLRRILSEPRSGSPREFTAQLLYSKVSPPSLYELISELNSIVDSGKLQLVYRINSPSTGAGIYETLSLQDLPESVYDFSQNEEIRVVPTRDLEVVYRQPTHAA